MMRRISSETLDIFAIDSTSESVNFGLLRTATAINLFGSRIRMARSSRVPFVALAIFCGTFISASRCIADFSSSSSSAMSGPAAVFHDRLVRFLRRHVRGSTPRFAKNSRISADTSVRARKAESEAGGIIPSVALAAAATSGSGSAESSTRQGELFVRARGECALCRLQANVVGHVAASEKVDERGPETDVH